MELANAKLGGRVSIALISAARDTWNVLETETVSVVPVFAEKIGRESNVLSLDALEPSNVLVVETVSTESVPVLSISAVTPARFVNARDSKVWNVPETELVSMVDASAVTVGKDPTARIQDVPRIVTVMECARTESANVTPCTGEIPVTSASVQKLTERNVLDVDPVCTVTVSVRGVSREHLVIF